MRYRTTAQRGRISRTPNPTLSTLGFKTFHRIVPSDNVEGTQGADWLAAKGLKNVFVVDDLSDYGTGVSNAVLTELKAKDVTTEHQGVDAKTTDYSGIATQVVSSGAGALFYAGYDAQAITATGGMQAHLGERYGTEARFVSDILQADPASAAPIVEGLPHSEAEIIYAARHQSGSTHHAAAFSVAIPETCYRLRSTGLPFRHPMLSRCVIAPCRT